MASLEAGAVAIMSVAPIACDLNARNEVLLSQSMDQPNVIVAMSTVPLKPFDCELPLVTSDFNDNVSRHDPRPRKVLLVKPSHDMVRGQAGLEFGIATKRGGPILDLALGRMRYNIGLV